MLKIDGSTMTEDSAETAQDDGDGIQSTTTIRVAKRLARFCINDAISENVIQDKAGKNILGHSDLLCNLAVVHLPEKLSFHLLTSVAEAFRKQVTDNATDEQLSSFTEYNIYPTIYFDYDERKWAGTVCSERSYYGGQLVNFINVKLPNDGFVYSNKYSADAVTDIVVCGEDTDIFMDCMIELFIGNLKTEIERAYMYYKAKAGRVEVYFWLSENKCITIKYEYGSHFSHTGAAKYDLSRLRSLQKK